MRAIFFTGYGLAIKPVVKQNDIILVSVFILLYGLGNFSDHLVAEMVQW